MDEAIREELFKLADRKYRDFSEALIPGNTDMIGVRLPKLRDMAKRIAKEDFEKQLGTKSIYFEEKMLKGLVIGYATMKDDNVDRAFYYLDNFIEEIDNWSVCDSFCNTFKVVRKDLEKSWHHIQRYLNSDEEFKVRVGLILILNHFIKVDANGNKISRKRNIEISDLDMEGQKGMFEDRIINVLDKQFTQGYYSMMAAAWTTAEMFTTYPRSTYRLLLNNKMDNETYNKSIRKICESLIPSKEVKSIVRKIKDK